ncbi:MAG: GNAT family N-acetyltransferase [Bacilli bacterium]|nr:GNAT family N-acetyltransferase [Bacilli bacterium]
MTLEEKIDLFEALETERLILRKIVDEDAEALYNNIYNNFEYFKFYYQVPFNTFEEYKPLVEKYKEWYANGNHFRWGIVLKETNEIIGLVQLHTRDTLNNHCKIGYIIGYNYTKKGYAKEAVQKVIRFGLDKLNFHRIEAEIVAQNESSIKIAEHVGMHLESLKEDSYKIGDQYYDQKVYTIINKTK